MKKRRILTGLISAVAVSLGLVFTSSAAVIGDVDNNGVLSTRDALAVLQSVAQLEVHESCTVTLETADMNADGVVDVKDAYTILTTATGSQYWAPFEPYDSEFSGEAYILGDSIAAVHNTPNYERPLMGWGVVFSDYFTDTITCRNYAISSESTKSYIETPNYGRAFEEGAIDENDYVFIAYGHNDHTPGEIRDKDRTTPLSIDGDEYAEGTFKWYLMTYYINPTLERGAVPILLNPVCRATFDAAGVFTEDPEHILYGDAVRELVEKYQSEGKEVYFIDTQTHTYNLYTEITKNEGGKDEVMSYHGYMGNTGSQWDFDSTHYCEKGARMLAEFIIESLQEQNLDMARYIRADWESVGK